MTVRKYICWNPKEELQIGDYAWGRLIGKDISKLYIWDECSKCGKARWVRVDSKTHLCLGCYQTRRRCWKPSDGEPRIGDCVHGFDIGKHSHTLYIWTVCPKCGEAKWRYKELRHYK